MKYKNPKYRWLAGLLLILVVYSIFYLFFVENPNIEDVPRKFRHMIKFVTTITVYFIGTTHLGELEAKWMSILWHFIHISLLFTITMIGLYDWTFGMVDVKTKELAASMQEILISPVLYVGMLIANNKLGNQFSDKK